MDDHCRFCASCRIAVHTGKELIALRLDRFVHQADLQIFGYAIFNGAPKSGLAGRKRVSPELALNRPFREHVHEDVLVRFRRGALVTVCQFVGSR